MEKASESRRISSRYCHLGRVYQNPSLGTCPNLTMLENLSLADNKGKRFGLGFGVNKKRIDAYRAELAALGLGLEDKLDVKMGALSGGPAPGSGPADGHHDPPELSNPG